MNSITFTAWVQFVTDSELYSDKKGSTCRKSDLDTCSC